MGACVVKTKKNLNQMFQTFYTAGSIIINARNFAGLRFRQRKRRPSDQYFETDKLLYEEVLQEQPLGLLSPDQINTLLQAEQDSEITRAPTHSDTMSLQSHEIVKIPLQVKQPSGVKRKQIEVQEEQKQKDEEEVMREQLLNMESDEEEKDEVRKLEDENVVLVEEVS